MNKLALKYIAFSAIVWIVPFYFGPSWRNSARESEAREEAARVRRAQEEKRQAEERAAAKKKADAEALAKKEQEAREREMDAFRKFTLEEMIDKYIAGELEQKFVAELASQLKAALWRSNTGLSLGAEGLKLLSSHGQNQNEQRILVEFSLSCSAYAIGDEMGAEYPMKYGQHLYREVRTVSVGGTQKGLLIRQRSGRNRNDNIGIYLPLDDVAPDSAARLFKLFDSSKIVRNCVHLEHGTPAVEGFKKALSALSKAENNGTSDPMSINNLRSTLNTMANSRRVFSDWTPDMVELVNRVDSSVATISGVVGNVIKSVTGQGVKCRYCKGIGRVQSTSRCSSCNGKGQVRTKGQMGVDIYAPCSSCNGSGKISGYKSCRRCNGSGFVK